MYSPAGVDFTATLGSFGAQSHYRSPPVPHRSYEFKVARLASPTSADFGAQMLDECRKHGMKPLLGDIFRSETPNAFKPGRSEDLWLGHAGYLMDYWTNSWAVLKPEGFHAVSGRWAGMCAYEQVTQRFVVGSLGSSDPSRLPCPCKRYTAIEATAANKSFVCGRRKFLL